MRATTLEMLAGVALDLAIGDPRWLPHPVRGFGWLATHLERIWRSTRLPLRAAGVLFWLTAVTFAGTLVWFTMLWVPRPWISIWWIFALLAIRDLDVEASLVVGALSGRNVESARKYLALIVGRDTESLDEPEILRATIETVAENLSDAVIAPLFYLALGGPVAMAVYKAVNTLDSMVGHKNARYAELGWASARMDDVANFIPARLTAFLIFVCALAPRYDFRRSVAVTLRDAHRQPSPNSGYPEAAVAGALGVRLGGVNYYGGVSTPKAHLGDAMRPLNIAAYSKTRALLYGSAALMVIFDAGIMR